MKVFRFLSLSLALVSCATLSLSQAAAAQTEQDALALVRSLIQADRQAVVAETLQLTDTESRAFWPLYHQYRAEMDKLGDRLLNAVQEYAAAYPDIPADQAKKLLRELNDVEKKRVSTRTAYLKKFGKVLPADRNLRLAQVERRLDIVLALEMANEIPLVPVEGELTGEAIEVTAAVEGVPGGVVVKTVRLTATVTAIDRANRTVALLGMDGFKTTVKAGPEVENFDQVAVGDRITVSATEALVVAMARPGEAELDGVDAALVLAPLGAKPGGVVAATVQTTATVVAIDAVQRTATLRFIDGTSETFTVRDDIDLGQRKVGEQVVFSVVERIALEIEPSP